MTKMTLLRRRLALTTILTVAPFFGYGREVRAACAPDPAAPAFLCSGEETVTQSIQNVPNADVSTAPGFKVTTDTGNGITITGRGNVGFTDTNGATIEGADDGLSVRSTNDDGDTPGSVKITTNGTITGGKSGINARNQSSGSIEITVDGKVTGKTGSAIRASNSEGADNLTIVTGEGSEVIAEMDEYYNGGSAISARNLGRGTLDITINGDLTSEHYHGIYAYNSFYTGGDLKITVGAESTIKADYNGIDAGNYGTGNLNLIIDGKVTSEYGLAGVVAFNRDEGGDLTIATGAGSVITGQNRGIMAKQYGHGDLEIIARGEVTGTDFSAGIYSEIWGDGEMRITVGATGLVQGKSAGIEASSGGDQAITITNDGTVRNIDELTTSRAIYVGRGTTTINNNGLILGTIKFTDYHDGDYSGTVNNDGTWNFAGGTSIFGIRDARLNNRGTLVAADDSQHSETTRIEELKDFHNSGALMLSDGQAGDVLEITGAVRYSGNGGRLVVDAELAPGGKSDRMIVNGAIAGVTEVQVKPVGAMGANTEGIAVVEVKGDSSAGDFTIADSSRNMGFFTWDMRRNAENGNLFELYSEGLGAGAYEFAGGITAAQDIWYQSTGTLLQRQADLRATISGTQVTPVADFAEPVAPTPAGRVMPGFWFKTQGAYLRRDAEERGFTLDRSQRVISGLAGFDAGLDLGNAGETLLFGVFGGYLTSDLRFKSTDTKWEYEGPSVGAYASYLSRSFYADLTVKADFLSIDIDADDLAPGEGKADTDGLNIGGELDAGYKISIGSGLFLEPQASLAVLHTEIDKVDDILGGAVKFDDETSVRGRLGARLGHEFTAGNGMIFASDLTASLWQEFNGSNSATIFAPDFAAADVTDDPIKTFGDMSVGLSVTDPEGWSSFLRGSWQFAEDFDAVSANAGLRYAW